MKKVKRLCSLLLALAMVLSMVPHVVKAATKDEIPTKIRMYRGQDERAIEIKLGDLTQSIDNIKTSNKNLVAKLCGTEYTSSGNTIEGQENRNEYYIGLRSKKEGTYEVSFDILDENKNKIETKSVKVYAYGSPIKSITFDGKNFNYNEISGTSAKVKVTLTSGNKIKKLQYGVYKLKKENNSTRSEVVYKTFKNGAKITLGKQAYYYLYEYSNQSENYSYQNKNFNTNMGRPTYIQITYYDKYTKQNETYIQSYTTYAE